METRHYQTARYVYIVNTAHGVATMDYSKELRDLRLEIEIIKIDLKKSHIFARENIDNLKKQISTLKNDKQPATIHLTFGEALEHLKQNKKVTRMCWHNPNIYLWLWDNTDECPPEKCSPEIRVKTVRGIHAPWMPNHTELLANDWMVVDEI
jgi:hypothetical protein